DNRSASKDGADYPTEAKATQAVEVLPSSTSGTTTSPPATTYAPYKEGHEDVVS
ncbi:unnamed protein product, partial [Amoebophrya sp. A25]